MKKLILIFSVACLLGAVEAKAQIVNSAGNVFVISEVNNSQVTLAVYESEITYKEAPETAEHIGVYIPAEKLKAAEAAITSLDGMTLLEKRYEIIYQLLIEESKTNFRSWPRTSFEKSDLKKL